MASKFHKNAILTGYIDYYCLVCESYIRTEEDAYVHIEKPIHKKNLGYAVYFEKFKGDHIWKVKKGYFCEFCNKFLTTAAKVGLHVAEPTHNDNKGTQLLKRVGDSIIMSNNTFINDKAWNGIISETCVLCNVKFNNENIHKTSQEHILNLILKKVEFITESDFYRKIDTSSFQCLTCNLIFSLETINTHFKDENHIKNYVACSKFTLPTSLGKNKDETAMKSTMLAKNVTENHNLNADLKTGGITKSVDEAKYSKTEKPNQVNPDNKAKTEKPNIVNPENIAKSSKTEKSNIVNPDNKTKSSKTEKPNIVNPKNKAKTEKPNIVNANNEAKSSKTDKPSIVNPSITRSSKTDSTECDENSLTKNIIHGNSNKANNKAKCDKKPHFCKDEDSEYETEFNTLMKDSVISGVVTDMNKMWKKEDKPDAKKSKVNNNNREQKKAKILDSVTDFQKNGVNVNFENDSVFCKKCFENLDFSFEAIKRHIDEHKNKPTNQLKAEFIVELSKNHSKTDIKNHDLDKNHNIANRKTKNYDNETENNFDKVLVSYMAPANALKTDNEKTNRTETLIPGTFRTQSARVEPKDPISYAKANHMTCNKGNNNAYCRICNARVPANLKNMKEHVNGHVHKSKAGKVAAEKQIIPKKPMKKFIIITSSVASMYNDDVIINDKFCMTRLSYLMITENGLRLRCQACEVTLTEDDLDGHLETCWHERAMEMTPVVWSLHTEFVREVRPGLFHCGFCNLIVGPWEDVASHLKCTDHNENKEDAAHRLGEHLPGILEYRRNKERLFFNMAMRRFGFDLGFFF